MQPYLEIFGREFSMYAVCAAAGALAVLGWLFIASHRRKTPPENSIFVGLVSVVGLFIGAHLLYGITNIPGIIAGFKNYGLFDDLWQFLQYQFSMIGGMVFYGGLIGAIVAGYIYVRKSKLGLDLSLVSDIFAPAVPLFHFFGRLGCFFGGCCYGIEWEHGITFTNSAMPSANGVPRLPIQLIEASFNLLLFIVLAILFLKNLRTGRLFSIYLLSYAPARFIFEFFRGDINRGVWLGLSTSQWISIAIVLVTSTVIIVSRINARKPSASL